MTEKIKSYHIYTLVDCPACKRAIKLLQEKKRKLCRDSTRQRSGTLV